jgi:hypothetical protein
MSVCSEYVTLTVGGGGTVTLIPLDDGWQLRRYEGPDTVFENPYCRGTPLEGVPGFLGQFVSDLECWRNERFRTPEDGVRFLERKRAEGKLPH